MKLMWLPLSLILLTGLAEGQASTVRSVSSLPATCNPGGGAGGAPADHIDLWNGSANVAYFCSSLNTWSPVVYGSGTTGQDTFFVGTGPAVNGDTCTTDGSGNKTCTSFTTNGAGAGKVDFSLGTTPANPAAGFDRVYGDSGSGNILCLNHAGTNCFVVGSAAFSAITNGTNTGCTSCIGGSAFNLSPLNTGQIAGSQLWMIPGITAPAVAINTTGGSIVNGNIISVQYSLVNAAGETLPSVISAAVQSASCSGGNSCSVTVTAPTIPTGYTGYTVYANNVSIDALYHKQTATNACVNITTNCTITAVTASGQPLTVSTAYVQPPNAQATNGPNGWIPSVWFTNPSGNNIPWLGVDPNSDNGTGPGTPTFTFRTFWRDDKFAVQSYKNSMIGFAHLLGTNTATNNQDRGIAGVVYGPTAGDSTTRYGVEGVQVEVDNNCIVATCLNGSPDAEYSVFSGQMQDNATQSGYTLGGGYGENVFRGELFKAGIGNTTAPYSILFGRFDVNQGTFSGGTASIVNANCLNNTATLVNLACIGLQFTMTSGTRFGNGQYAVYVPNLGTAAAIPDLLIRNDKHNYNSNLNGNIYANGLQMSDLGSFALNASVNLTGGLAATQITSGWTTGYSVSCSGGASNYTYQFVAIDQNGGTSTSATFNCSSGTNPLTGGNPATLSPGPGINGGGTLNAQYSQAKQIDVYRVGGPMGTGKIGSLTCNTNILFLGCNPFSDTGLTASGSLPSGNTTGSVNANRFATDKSTTLVAGDFAVGANWGSTASTAITVATSKDQASVTTITTGGSGIAANPTYQITFHDGTWTQVPVCTAIQTGGNDIIGDLTVTSRSATSYTFQWNATPTTGKTYEITIQCMGT